MAGLRNCGAVNCFSRISAEQEAAEPAKIVVRDLARLDANGASLLSGVSFSIRAASIHGLIGLSGSGKSTVLRALNRLWEPPKNTVLLDGQDITKLDVISLRRRVGMVFQAPCLFPGTVADNVRYGPLLRGQCISDDTVEKLLMEAGISDPSRSFMLKVRSELSGGEAQRVSLARSLANEPDVLLLDEPTSALDPVSTRIVESTLLELQSNQGMTIVLVSHNMQQVERMTSMVTALHEGSLLASGTFQSLKSLENSVLKQLLTD